MTSVYPSREWRQDISQTCSPYHHAPLVIKPQLEATMTTMTTTTTTTNAKDVLASIWTRILDLPAADLAAFGQTTSFFALGAKAIDVVRMVAAAKRQGFVFSVKDVYATPSLDALQQRR
ncbi:hypothetical protein BDZ88DRAFT_491920 [Geranomyces variabilis]|nr:hypothetical protein BDZ88DRAFT_491920 [Geranomyces variabilis]KAJ3136138.1 hypothetical protein HDU90_003541 [Geranomyces variabilis]